MISCGASVVGVAKELGSRIFQLVARNPATNAPPVILRFRVTYVLSFLYHRRLAVRWGSRSEFKLHKRLCTARVLAVEIPDLVDVRGTTM